jgi:predicted acetyltransferase
MSNNPKIEYRKLTPEEDFYFVRLQGFVFGNGNNNEKEMRERLAKGEWKCDNTYGAVDENGRVLAGLEIIPYTMWFDGHKVSIYGIGGVASMPESRRQGNVRKVFEKAMTDIYEQGGVFSHLYPFSHDYYRKFGYEQCGAAKKYIIPLEPARKLKNNGTACEYIKGDNVNDKLIEVYETFAARHNIMLSRSQDRWNHVFNVSLMGLDRIYYWKDAEQNIKAWVKFKRKDETIEIHDIAWVDYEAMIGMLQFIGMFEGAAEKLAMRSSPEFVAELFWNNLYNIHTENQWMGMSRVVNVKRALELMKKPEEDGKFVIKVVDDFAAWNNNTYAVEYGGGDCKVSESTSNADIETSARALVHMILGVYDFEHIACRDDVQVNGDIQMLMKLFYKKNMLITDYF